MYIEITQLPERTFKNANPSKRKIQIKVHNFSPFVAENFNFRILMRSDALWKDAHSSSGGKPYMACHNRWAIRTEHALTLARKRPLITGQIQYGGARKECFCKVICHKTTF